MLNSNKARDIGVKARSNNTCYNSFRYLLHDTELQRLEYYERLWKEKTGRSPQKGPNAVFHLGDSPWSRVCWSLNGRFPTFRKSMKILWHSASQTIVTPREKLALMGWPVYADLACSAGLGVVCFPDLKRAHFYSGNGYHIATFGMWLLTCLACMKFTQD